MDIDYLLILLPGIVCLGFLGLIFVIWQYGHLRKKKEHTKNKDPEHTPPAQVQRSEHFVNTRCDYSSTQDPEKPLFNEPMTEPALNKTPDNTTPPLIILHLLATADRPYAGYELIQTLSSAGFYYGAMNIFHYHENKDAKNPQLFSMASAIEPGTFDLTSIAEIVLPGLCLFMPFDAKNAADNFELMLETAQLLIQDLGGTLCDKQRQPLTESALTFYRSQLYSYA